MNIFISWSGEQSLGVAAALQAFIRSCLPATKPWFSSEILDGERWQKEIYKSIERANLGIVCFTRTNFKDKWVRSWLGFEAGMLVHRGKGQLVVLSVGLDRQQFADTPFAAYQITTHERDSVFRMLRMVNQHKALPKEKRKSDKQLENAFNRHWPKLEAALLVAVNWEYTWAERKEVFERIIAEDASRKASQADTSDASAGQVTADLLARYAEYSGLSQPEQPPSDDEKAN